MQVLIQPIQDIIRHYAITQVSISDPVIRTAISGLIIACMSVVFSYDWKGLYLRKMYPNLIRYGEDCSMFKFDDYYLKKPIIDTSSVPLDSQNAKFFNAEMQKMLAATTILNVKDRKIEEYADFVKKTMILYTLGNEVCTFTYTGDKFNIGYSSIGIKLVVKKLLDESQVYIAPVPTPEQKPLEVKQCKIWEIEKYDRISTHGWGDYGKTVGLLYPDITFDTYISKHKNRIINYINRVIENHQNPKPYANYNIGIMLEGPPGTGKTLLVKVIANHFKRHIVNVNLSKIPTATAFSKLIGVLKNDVIVLDEFDCIQGALKRDGITDDKISQLEERRRELILARGEHNGSIIADEIKKIDEEILKESDKINLYTILTTLDGVCEQRGRVIIACTNHLEKIDPALMRPGRFDLVIKLDFFTREEIGNLLINYYKHYGGVSTDDIEYIRSQPFRLDSYTPAKILNIIHSGSGELKDVCEELCK